MVQVQSTVDREIRELKFRDPQKAKALTRTLERICQEFGRDVSVMHVCVSH